MTLFWSQLSKAGYLKYSAKPVLQVAHLYD